MSGEQDHKPSKLINVLDKVMHDDILRLDQKLKGLQAEIAAKMDAMSYTQDENADKHKKYLAMLSEEISKATQSIHKLVTMVISEGVTDNAFLKMNKEDLEAFHEVVKENAERIAQLKEQF